MVISKRKFKDPFLMIDQTDDQNLNQNENVQYSESSSEDDQKKRIKTAKKYLKKIENSKDEINKNISLHKKLFIDHQKSKKIIYSTIFNDYDFKEIKQRKIIAKHGKAVTSISVNGDYIFTASKDGSIIKTNILTTKKENQRKANRKGKINEGHCKAVLALSLSPNGVYLASAGREGFVYIWSAEDLKLIHVFRGHRREILSLVFSEDSKKLYSASFDNMVRMWDIEKFTFIEKLFGHEQAVNCLDFVSPDRILSCSSDRTIRIFKIENGTQLIYKALSVHSASLDCCAFLTRKEFIVGSQDGSLSLWSYNSKKPICVIKKAHGGSWITCVTTIFNTDCILTGSSDGYIRVWKHETNPVNKDDPKIKNKELAKLTEISKIPLKGFINQIVFVKEKNAIFAAVAREHRLGRWSVLKDVVNHIEMVEFEELKNNK